LVTEPTEYGMVGPEHKEYEILLTEYPKHGILPSERT
jgi:hypothetical protein